MLLCCCRNYNRLKYVGQLTGRLSVREYSAIGLVREHSAIESGALDSNWMILHCMLASM